MNNNSSHFGFQVSMETKNMSDHSRSWRDTSDIVYGVVSVLLIPCICGGNFMVLISMWKFRKLRTKANIFVANLSVADSIMGAVSLPMYTAFFLNREYLETVKYMCISKYSIVVFSSSASLLSLTAIAVDRYIAVIHPLKYHVLVTPARVRYFLIGQWTYDIITFTIPYFWNNYDRVQSCNFYVLFPRLYSVLFSFVSIAVCLAVSLYLYIRIFLVARKHRKYLNSGKLSEGNHLQRRRDAKSAKVMALILFLFFLFWLPFLLVGPVRYLGIAEDLMVIFKNITLLIAMSNSMVNPIIYCWLRKDFSTAFKKLCCCDSASPKRKGGSVMSYSLDSTYSTTTSNYGNTDHIEDANQDGNHGSRTQGCHGIQQYHKLEASQDGSQGIQQIGSQELQQESSHGIQQNGSQGVQHDGNEEVQKDGNQKVKKDGSQEVQQDASQEVQTDGNERVQEDGSQEVQNDGNQEVQEEGSQRVL